MQNRQEGARQRVILPVPLFFAILIVMDRHFRRPINAVRFRQRVQQTLNYAAWGLFVAAFVALLLPPLAVTIFAVSVVLGFARSCSLSSAARLIDRHYHLKDRILTATALLRRTHRTPMEQLQIDDTAEHLTIVQPRTVYPIRLPKMFWIALGVFALHAAGTAILHSRSPLSSDIESATQAVLSEENTTLLAEIVATTDELTQTHTGEPSLRELSEQLEVFTRRFETASMDTRETLMTLSEIKNAFQSALDSLKLETMDELLQNLAKTLELAEPTLPISKALERGDYGQAASELKKLDSETLESLTQPERNAMAEQMQAIAKDAEKYHQQPLQEAAQKMSDALKEGDSESGAAAADALANEVEKHGIRKEIGVNLAHQLMELGMMKAESGMAMDGGKHTDKSDTASETWGSGAAGNPTAGQETQLEGERQQQLLTGMLGEEGESLAETVDAHEMTETRSLQQYREQHQHYQKISEAVLATEPIPQGQRQVIRHYFESIRPVTE